MWTPGVSITKASEEMPGMELPISLKARTLNLYMMPVLYMLLYMLYMMLNLYMMPHRMLSSIVLVSAPSVWVTITQFPDRTEDTLLLSTIIVYLLAPVGRSYISTVYPRTGRPPSVAGRTQSR